MKKTTAAKEQTKTAKINGKNVKDVATEIRKAATASLAKNIVNKYKDLTIEELKKEVKETLAKPCNTSSRKVFRLMFELGGRGAKLSFDEAMAGFEKSNVKGK